MKTSAVICSLSLVLALSACTQKEETSDTSLNSYSSSEIQGSVSTTSSSHTMKKSEINQAALPQAGDDIAVISTKFGDITLRFFPEAAPKTVENFLTHAKNGYYDGVIFHRIIDGFMIQGGDPNGTGTGGQSIWGGKFEDEFHEDLSNIRGSISMANAGPNTNGSQFFINQADNTFLDGRHSVFGQVIDGMEVVDQIATAEKDARDKPLEEIAMEVTGMKYGEGAE